MVPDTTGAQLGITSDGFFELKKQPKKVAVIGAGYVGLVTAAGASVVMGFSAGVFFGAFALGAGISAISNALVPKPTVAPTATKLDDNPAAASY